MGAVVRLGLTFWALSERRLQVRSPLAVEMAT
jgi:hypothetical protein